MFMKRMFLPVGQGAFYCERFSKRGAPKWDKNFVYDCGVLLKDSGSPDAKLQWLENVIDVIESGGQARHLADKGFRVRLGIKVFGRVLDEGIISHNKVRDIIRE